MVLATLDLCYEEEGRLASWLSIQQQTHSPMVVLSIQSHTARGSLQPSDTHWSGFGPSGFIEGRWSRPPSFPGSKRARTIC